jgi:hypothetical protein
MLMGARELGAYRLRSSLSLGPLLPRCTQALDLLLQRRDLPLRSTARPSLPVQLRPQSANLRLRCAELLLGSGELSARFGEVSALLCENAGEVVYAVEDCSVLGQRDSIGGDERLKR